MFLCSVSLLYLPFSLVNPTTLNPIIELIEFWQENRFKVLDWLDLRRWSSQRYYHRARKWYNIDSNANGKQVPLPIARLFCASSTSLVTKDVNAHQFFDSSFPLSTVSINTIVNIFLFVDIASYLILIII